MGIKEIDYKTNFGNVKLKLNELMDKKGISIGTMSKLANVKYEMPFLSISSFNLSLTFPKLVL